MARDCTALEPGGPGMSEITFNVNHKVKAKLNDRGRKIQAEYYAPFGDGPKPDSDGWTEYQMWCLMHVFGEHCYMWPEPPFETNIRIIVDDPDLSALRAEVERLVGLVMELTDAGECWYDHHGLCQAHSLQERPCPHSRAKDLLKAKGALSGAGKEE